MDRKLGSKSLNVLILVSALLLAGCGNGNGPTPISVPEKYFLAFESGIPDDPIIVRWSDDGGVNWETADFPGNTPNWGHDLIMSHGVGAAGGQGGLQYLVTTTQYGKPPTAPMSLTNVQWSSRGPRIWDGSTAGSPVELQTFPDTVSAPSAAWIGDGRYLIARQWPASTVDVRIFDTSDGDPRELGGWLYARGRPALAIMDNRIVLAWQSSRQEPLPLVILTGHLENGFPVWDAPYDLPLPDDYRSGIDYVYAASDPDLTHDGQRFYLAFAAGQDFTQDTLPAPDYGGDTLGPCGDIAAVFSSPDGETWQFHSNIRGLDVVCNLFDKVSYINIAAQTDGSLLAAAFKGYPGEVGDITVSQFNGTTWTKFNDAQVEAMFGSTRLPVKQFALIGVEGQ